MKESGIGRENGIEAMDACGFQSASSLSLYLFDHCSLDSQSKSTIVNVATAEENRQNDDWFADAGGQKRYG